MNPFTAKRPSLQVGGVMNRTPMRTIGNVASGTLSLARNLNMLSGGALGRMAGATPLGAAALAIGSQVAHGLEKYAGEF